MSTRSFGGTRRIRGRRAVLAGASIATVVAGSLAGATSAAAAGKGPFTPGATPTQASSYSVAKSLTSRLAQTDPSLLKITSSAPVHVIVKLDYDSLATYTGTIPGYAATSPLVTHKPLDAGSAASQKYLQHVAAVQNSFTSALASSVPSAKTGTAYTALYGGLALTVPGNEISRVLSLPGVSAIQSDSLHTATSATPVNDDDASFIGGNAAYSALGSSATAGKGVIVADIDTGVWPEHPAFASRSDLASPPPTADNHPRACNFGTNPLTSVPFSCNDKLIEGQVFLNTYNSLFPTGPNAELYAHTARDSNGHGTHTTSTAAGNPIAHPTLFGIDRGPIQGIAPGAYVMSYKVLGPLGGFDSDLVAGIEQAVLDGANVINYSIGPTTPTSAYTSADDLAFLDAYDAGVVVSASAGNSGPGAQTVSHLGPWEITVGATTLQRAFVSTATLSAPGASNLVVNGSSIMPGISSATPVVLASAAPYSDSLCGHAAAPGTFTGKIVVCVRGGVDSSGNAIGRVQKGFNVLHGGAAGMFLVNPVVEDTETDNHFLPAVHFDAPAGSQVVSFVTAHPGTVTATFTTGQKANGQGDVMAAFSSRGPGGDFLKPDIAAPGVQILAGNTPTPTDVASGPSGQYYQAIAGTSMAAPHITGSAALVLALHPGLTPAEVKSVLMMTANTSVVKQDGSTPAGPFDDGAGRVSLGGVVDPGLAMDVSNADMDNVLLDPLHRIDLNEPSVYDASLPGRVTTTRTFTNIGSTTQVYQLTASSTLPGSITVSPTTVAIAAGTSRTVTITLDGSSGTIGHWYTGEIDLTQAGGNRKLHLPVAFSPSAPAASTLSTATNCAPTTIALVTQNSVCTTTVQNNLLQDASVSAAVSTNHNLQIVGVGPGGSRTSQGASYGPVTLAAATPPKPSIGPGSSPAGGFLDLHAFSGNLSVALGDETITNVNVPGFVYDGVTYTRIGVVSDGYLVVGGGDGNDVNFEPQTFPDPARPNNVLAPFWTDLDGGAGSIPGQGALVNVLCASATQCWVVVQVDAHLFGTNNVEHFQVWLGINGTQDISYTYGELVDPGTSQQLNIGAENADGTAGGNFSGIPSGDLVVTSSAAIPGGSASFSTTVRGVQRGAGTVETDVTSPQIRDTIVTRNNITVS